MKNNQLTLKQAKEKGYTKVYFNFDCIGDTILFMSAAELLAKQNKSKILVGGFYQDLFYGSPYIDILQDFSENTICTGYVEELKKNNIDPVFITASRFIEDPKLGLRFAWGDQHILANLCSRLGVKGEVPIDPKIYLTNDEKNFGRFFADNQISIISTGTRGYKSLPLKKTQEVVDQLSSKYNFVQIGAITDPLLERVIDMREDGNLRNTASILYNSDLFVGGIGGLMHMSRSVGCRSVVAYTAGEPAYLEDYECNVNVHPQNPICHICGDNKLFPYQSGCIKEEYFCISDIDTQEITKAIDFQMHKANHTIEIQKVTINPDPANGLEDYIKRFKQIKVGRFPIYI